MQTANEVLEFWFARDAGALRLEERMTFWFGGDGRDAIAARDQLIRATLEPLLERAARGEFAGWAASPRRRLALILLFDQVPRNAYRGTAAAFAFDREALGLALEGIHLAADAALDPLEKMFFYLPLEHAESLEAQDACVAAFHRLLNEAPEELRAICQSSLEYAQQHREIIRQFGRFPYRNGVLNRASTDAERAWLSGQPDSFGQGNPSGS